MAEQHRAAEMPDVNAMNGTELLRGLQESARRLPDSALIMDASPD